MIDTQKEKSKGEELVESHKKLYANVPDKKADEARKTEFDAICSHLANAVRFLHMAIADQKAFINQCDREGLGMKVITDNRKRIEKFTAQLNKEFPDGI